MRAFREGGKVRQPGGKGGLDQLLWLAASAQTPTEARQLLENFLDRVEKHTQAVAAWEDEAKRRERVDLLRPYMMDAYRGPRRDNKYAIVLYNGRYS